MSARALRLTMLAVLLLTLLGLPALGVQADPKPRYLDVSKLYVPDLKAELFAEAAELGGNAAPAAAGSWQIPWWADMVNKELVPEDGEGVYVAVLDTGLLSVWPQLFEEGRIDVAHGKGFTHELTWDRKVGDVVIGPLEDDRGFITGLASGHGTHVASTIAGYHYSSATADFWVAGIAPKATIIPVLVLDAWEVKVPKQGTQQFSGGTDEMVSAGIRYVADLKAGELAGHPVVINMSLGGPDPSPMIEDAVNYAISKGVIVVASAGNDGVAGMGYPGAYPQVISAGAGGWPNLWTLPGRFWLADVPENLNTIDNLGNNWQLHLEEFSSRPLKSLGQKSTDLDVTTPGASIVGPYKDAFSDAVGFYYLWGTSMAAPHVTGIAALVAESHPDLGQVQMESILKSAASGAPFAADGATVVDPWCAPCLYKWYGGDYGNGLLRADAALQAAH